MKCRILFSGKNKKKKIVSPSAEINLSSDEFTDRVVKVNYIRISIDLSFFNVELYYSNYPKYPNAQSKQWKSFYITKTRLFKYIENCTTKKGKISDKIKSDIFHIHAQNIDYGYSLEPPLWGGSNEYHNLCFSKTRKNNVYPCKLQFYCIKVGFKGVKII